MITITKRQDFWAGLLFIAFGAAGLWFGRNYPIGAATKMGAGYLPAVLSGGLLLIGALISLRALALTGAPIERGQLRPQLFILASVVAFGLLIERAGLALAVVAAAVLASLASRDVRGGQTAVLAAGLAAACIVLFVRILGQPLAIWPF